MNFQTIYDNPCFWQQLDRIAQSYVDHGGRNFIYKLVALYCHLTSDENVKVSDSESDSEDNKNSDESPANKLKFHQNE